MKLEGMHHITMITRDARRNVEFYADVLGLRMVKKTVNFDAPEAYRVYDGLAFELVVADDGNLPLRAVHPEVPTTTSRGSVGPVRVACR